MDRNPVFTFGPRFFKDGDETMFEFVVDAGNKFGPMPATAEHKAKHGAAWAAFAGDAFEQAEAEPEAPPIIQYARQKHEEIMGRRRGRPPKTMAG